MDESREIFLSPPPEAPLALGTFNRALTELQNFGNLSVTPLNNNKDGFLYDRIPEYIPEDAELGKRYVINNDNDVQIGEQIEIGILNDPGVIINGGPESPYTLLGYVEFRKDHERGAFNGSMLFLGSRAIEINAESLLKGPVGSDLERELGIFARNLGLLTVWVNYAHGSSVGEMADYKAIASNRQGTVIAKSLSRLRNLHSTG